MKPKKIFLTLTLISTLLSATYYVFLLNRQIEKIKSTKPLPVLGQVMDFDLRDSNDQPFRLKDLEGKVWVADFIFTTCSGICPLMTQNMLKLYKKQINQGNIRFVSISVNPEQDTPAVLTQYADKFSINTKKWHLLTGPRPQIEDLAINHFKVGSVKEPVFHSSYFVLVDPVGKIRGYYEGTESGKLKKMDEDIDSLMVEFGYELR